MSGFILSVVLAIFTGILGYIIGRTTSPKNAGIFLVDDTDSEKTRWTLDVHMNPDDIPKKKYLRFKVHVQK